ncbi:MAG TPA: hypothetical protein VNS32_22995, partial [Flavisolibacter sp.]|nr:hypothetical protein [Flavisolibacter sp.]
MRAWPEHQLISTGLRQAPYHYQPFKMTLSVKHIGLFIGIVSIFLSFLFIGRQQGIYQILLL